MATVVNKNGIEILYEEMLYELIFKIFKEQMVRLPSVKLSAIHFSQTTSFYKQELSIVEMN